MINTIDDSKTVPVKLRPTVASRIPLAPSTLVIFGITGDLARKKLLPAVYQLFERGLLPPTFSLLGFGRQEPVQVLGIIRKAMEAGAGDGFQESVWNQIAERFRYVRGTFDDLSSFETLRDELACTADPGGSNFAFYMSISPDHFAQVCMQLKAVGLHRDDTGWRRVVVEKPFGNDLSTSRALGDTVSSVFGPESVYRVDHYLGKETVQNILALRFANGLFEPLWNHHHIDHVQITMAEEIGVTGRAGYYDGVGATRDVIQNHLLQILALIAMEEPVTLSAEQMSTEKVKVLSAAHAIGPFSETTSRGQYTATTRNGTYFPGLAEEDGFDGSSTTETFAALTVQIANRRWAGVPFFIRAGKRLGRQYTEIAVTFRATHRLHGTGDNAPPQNTLVVRVQPDAGISLRIGAKVPGSGMEIQNVDLNMSYAESFQRASPEAYERLILDVLRGDASLFPTQEEIEASWAVVDPVITHWATSTSRPDLYESGSTGPASADAVLSRSGRAWRP
ncbi:glucose-6-phosphate dehydrogenase [Rhodococcus sp. UFZ-B548]|uniref:glucose-6-phosphate dehydrogenase n=1 Tax=Rhodococcus sp. UFZ-B548 TaxID=2742212 RepID=UPI0015F7842A